MNDEARARAAWGRIEAWLAANLPAALENLQPPASEEQLQELSTTLGRPLPDALRACLLIHDGELDGWMPSAFADGHWFLPCTEIGRMWEQLVSLAEEMGGTEDAYDFWRAQVEDGIIFVDGPVKPRFGSRAWLPFSSLDGHVQRFIDFEPAPGGVEGQVIEVDPESCTYRVLAPSFVDFLEGHAAALERGAFEIGEDGLHSPEEGAADPTGWGIPAYLAEVEFEARAADPAASRPDSVAEGEEVELEGEMGMLLGGPEIIFSLETPDGAEHTFLAKPGLTKGYSSIAVRQAARVRARPYTSDVESLFVEQAGTEAPHFVALEYRMVR